MCELGFGSRSLTWRWHREEVARLLGLRILLRMHRIQHI